MLNKRTMQFHFIKTIKNKNKYIVIEKSLFLFSQDKVSLYIPGYPKTL